MKGLLPGIFIGITSILFFSSHTLAYQTVSDNFPQADPSMLDDVTKMSVDEIEPDLKVEYKHRPADINGQLRVCGKHLCNQYGHPIQLRGISTHGLQWYGWDKCVTPSSLDDMTNEWEADIIRVALYVQEGGYETDPKFFTAQVSRIIDEVSARGMYVLVDWHMLKPGDPNANLGKAKKFFKEIAQAHQDKTNILYEIANEPNGVNWKKIKRYADKIIPHVRKYDADAPIIVGTQGWSSLGVSEGRSVQDILDKPIKADNIMYSFHFYAASHNDIYLNALRRAADNLPIFTTEWGSQRYSGDGENDFAMAQRFVDLMAEKKISWTYWNYSDDKRSGAIWKRGTCRNQNWSVENLKPSGLWVREKLKKPADNFPIKQ